MAIYIDANILYRWTTFAELDRIALTIVSHQIKQHVVVPEVAAWEAEGHFRRSLESAVAGLKRAQKEANSAFKESLGQAPLPDVEERVAAWRERLHGTFSVVPTDPKGAVEGHRREALAIHPGRRRFNDRGMMLEERGDATLRSGSQPSAIISAATRMDTSSPATKLTSG
jgi:hypothetical protein